MPMLFGFDLISLLHGFLFQLLVVGIKFFFYHLHDKYDQCLGGDLVVQVFIDVDFIGFGTLRVLDIRKLFSKILLFSFRQVIKVMIKRFLIILMHMQKFPKMIMANYPCVGQVQQLMSKVFLITEVFLGLISLQVLFLFLFNFFKVSRFIKLECDRFICKFDNIVSKRKR